MVGSATQEKGVVSLETTNQYPFKERMVREFIRLTVEKVVEDINSHLHKMYDKTIYSEKIRYSNSKEYRKNHRKQDNNSDESIYAQLGYWSAHNRNGASNVPHISSGSYEGRVFNGIVEGYTPSITLEDYIDRETQKLIDELTDNDIVRMIKTCLKDPIGWRETSQYNEFCYSHQNGCAGKIVKQLEEIDSILKIPNTNHYSVHTREGFYVYEDKIEASFLRKIGTDELERVKDYCEIDVLILESGRSSHIIVYSNVYPSHKHIIGLKKGDTFTLPNISSSYKILKIY